MLFEKGSFMWSGAAGIAKSLTGAYADSSYATVWFGPYEEANYVILDFLLSAGVPTTIEFKFIWTPDDGTTVKSELPTVLASIAGVTQIGDGEYQLTDVGNGNHTAIIAIPPGTGWKLQLKYTGGAAPDAIVRGWVGHGDVSALASAAGGGGAGPAGSTTLAALAASALPAAAADGDDVRVLADLYGRLMSAAHDLAEVSDRTTRQNPEWSQHEGITLVDVTDIDEAVDAGIRYYYFSPEEFGRFVLQYTLHGGAGGPGLVMTLEATAQDDGTAMDSCTYEDVTNTFFGVANVTAVGGGGAVTGVWSDAAGEGACYKYLRLKLAADSTPNDECDATVFLRQRY